LYWSVGDSEQLPLELLRSLDTVIIAFKDREKVEELIAEILAELPHAFKDREKVEELIAEILAELPQAKQVSPGQAGWNGMLTLSKHQPKQSRIAESQIWV
jgi:negative regulator of genetic competence, sporulation and motility